MALRRLAWHVTQDPALYEDSPAIRAAVAEERRLSGIEAKLDLVLNQIGTLTDRVGIQNGRVSKLESYAEANRDAITANEARLKDRRLWERLEKIEQAHIEAIRNEARERGILDGRVGIRSGDKWAFGVFMALLTLGVNIALKFF